MENNLHSVEIPGFVHRSNGEEHAAAQPHPEPPVRRKLAPIGNPLLRPLPREKSSDEAPEFLSNGLQSHIRQIIQEEIAKALSSYGTSLILNGAGGSKQATPSSQNSIEKWEEERIRIPSLDRISTVGNMDTRKMHFPESLWSKGGRRRTSVVNDNVSVENFAMDKTEQDFEDEIEERFWLSVTENAYGAFIHTALQSSVLRAILLCGPMLTASVVLQLIFSIELLLALPSIQHQKEESCTNSGTSFDCVQPLCAIPSPLQIAALGVFMILMFNNVPNMYRHAQMALLTTRCKNGSGQETEIEKPIHFRIIIFILGVMSEVVTFSAILISGSLFIITARTVDLVIRSTVAIMFVQNVDEVVFGFILILVSAERGSDLRLHEDACCPQEITQAVSSTRYRVKWIILIPVRLPQDVSVRWEYYYGKRTHQNCALSEQVHTGLFFHLPFVFIVTVCVVFCIRWVGPVPCNDVWWGL